MKIFPRVLLCLLGILFFPTLHAEIQIKNQTVHFLYSAPKANRAEVLIDNQPYSMQRNSQGKWEYITTALTQDLHTYLYRIDGILTLDQQNPQRMRDITQTFNFFILKGGAGDVYEVQQVPHGTVQQVWYSTREQKQRRMSIYLPASYYTSDTYYPVLYLLHGSGGDEEAWLELGRTAQILDNLISAGQCKEMIVVMPNGNFYIEAAPTYSPSGMQSSEAMHLNGQFEENFSDIIAYTERNYRTITKKHSRAIAGLSMGGYHAMHISHYFSNLFDYIGLFSPTFSTYADKHIGTKEATLAFPVAKTTPRVYRNVEKDLVRQFQAPPQLYWIGIGTEDFLYEEVRQYRAYLDAHHYNYTYYETAGGHTWDNWRHYLATFLPLIF